MGSQFLSDEEQFALVQQITDPLELTNEQLIVIVQKLSIEIDTALQHSIRGTCSDSLRVFPTFINQVPTGNERGHYLALDLGGTNFRVLLIQLLGNRQSCLCNETYSISQTLMQSTGEHLFNYIAQCLYEFVRKKGLLNQRLMLGFTFSFPCEQFSRNEAVLIKWTKGFSCTDTVGQEVNALLTRSMSKYPEMKVEIAAIVNDTVGTLISCAYLEPECQMGVIIGTGINICYFESNYEGQEMIINTEIGSFGSSNGCLDFVRTNWDMIIDNQSVNPRQQVFEKMVSGMYLGEIVRLIVHQLAEQSILDRKAFRKFAERGSFHTSFISRVEMDNANGPFDNTLTVLHSMGLVKPSLADCRSLHLICSRVSTRSANLTSAVISSLLRHTARPCTVVGVDGSVYRCHPHFKTLLDNKIHQLLKLTQADNLQFRLMLSEDGSGRGAALIAALPVTAIGQKCRHFGHRCQANCPYATGPTACRLCTVSA